MFLLYLMYLKHCKTAYRLALLAYVQNDDGKACLKGAISSLLTELCILITIGNVTANMKVTYAVNHMILLRVVEYIIIFSFSLRLAIF